MILIYHMVKDYPIVDRLYNSVDERIKKLTKFKTISISGSETSYHNFPQKLQTLIIELDYSRQIINHNREKLDQYLSEDNIDDIEEILEKIKTILEEFDGPITTDLFDTKFDEFKILFQKLFVTIKNKVPQNERNDRLNMTGTIF